MSTSRLINHNKPNEAGRNFLTRVSQFPTNSSTCFEKFSYGYLNLPSVRAVDLQQPPAMMVASQTSTGSSDKSIFLYLKLPPELRTEIYHYLLGGITIHIGFPRTRFDCNQGISIVCQTSTSD